MGANRLASVSYGFIDNRDEVEAAAIRAEIEAEEVKTMGKASHFINKDW